jgi:hypothetical protein
MILALLALAYLVVVVLITVAFRAVARRNDPPREVAR